MLDLGLSILDLGLWLGGNPAPIRVSASLDVARQGPGGRAVGQRLRRLRERDVALRGRDLAPPRRRRAVRRRPARQQGHRGDQPAHRVEGAARRAGGRLADRVGQPGERLHRLVPGGVGPLRGRRRRARPRSRRCRTTSCCTRWWTRSTARRRTGETWCCEAARRGGGCVAGAVATPAPCLTASAGRCQAAAPPPPPAESELRVYLMTMGPGAAGLGAVRAQRDLDSRSVGRSPTPPTTTGCSTSGRRTSCSASFAGRCGTGWRAFPRSRTSRPTCATTARSGSRSSNLPPAARLELREFLRWNERPENRFYHYDYYRDNCSTRVRDAIDRVIGGAIKAQTAARPDRDDLPVPHPAAHRQRSARSSPASCSRSGQRVDRPISAWEEMFLPLALREHVRQVTVPGPDGTRVPLVASERTLFESTAPPPPGRAASWLHWYLLLGTVIGGSRRCSAAGRGDARRDGSGLGVVSPCCGDLVGGARRGSCWRGSGPSPITSWRTGTRTCSR